MTREEFKKRISELTKDLENDTDCYMLAHFSRIDDKYQGFHNIDSGEAIIIIRELIKYFDIELTLK